RGPTADALVAALGPDALLSQADLQQYRARVREPLRFSYRGFTVETMPPPSAGGVVVTLLLRGLERLAAHELPAGSAAEAHLFLELARRAQAERRFGVVDPDTLSASERRARRARWLDGARWVDRVPIDPNRATPSERVHPLFGMAMKELEHTTHFSVVDADGAVVSCTTTLSAGFGARLVAEGVVLNNSVASFGTAGDNQPAGGKRTISSMAPTLLLRGDEPFLVLGTPGGDSIPSTIVQVLRHVVDHEMDLADAVNAPRLHHGFVPDEARYERARPPPRQLLTELGKLGHRLAAPRAVMGDANDILINAGVAHAYADPREGGLAAAAGPASTLGD
ncbi:MAG TPA: gamma-glutamyltransferase, partial [Polyangiaceae bacterium]|nr:gamma-glutamyltransferase [Polyangiaceae bacterium]